MNCYINNFEKFFKQGLLFKRAKKVSDHKLFIAEIPIAQSYCPFGMILPGRFYNAEKYRFGFNGKENDNEVNGVGNQQDYGMRVYDARIAKWFSIDPAQKKFPNISPYASVENNPVYFNDPDGKNATYTIKDNTIKFTSQIYIIGAGATEAKATEMQEQIMAKFGGNTNKYEDKNGQVYNVKFDIQVHVLNSSILEQNKNLVNGSANVVALIDNPKQDFRDYVDGQKGNIGVWRTNSTDPDVYAHETAHFLGLADQYFDNYYSKVANPTIKSDYSVVGYNLLGVSADDLLGLAANNEINGQLQQASIDNIAKFALENKENVVSKDGSVTGKIIGGGHIGKPSSDLLYESGATPNPIIFNSEIVH